MKFEARARRGVVNLIVLDDAGNVVLDVDGIPPQDARDMSKNIRLAARAAERGVDGLASIRSDKPPSA